MTEPAIRDAASLILLRRTPRGAAVLMGMRGQSAAFMPSKYVFPGGAVDPGDGRTPLARPLAEPHRRRLLVEPSGAASPGAIAAAGLRELAEETGLLIGRPAAGTEAPAPFAEAGLWPDAGTLTYLFRAITPPGRPRRFDAHFFVADAASLVGDPDDFGRACDELSHLHWVALDEARRLDLPFITEVVLAELSALAAAAAPDEALPVPASVPFFDNRGPSPRFVQID
ncbi:NUDIX hydrolase [Paracoccus tibetensis]|uniref:Nudix hydrolase domain-containing protein n=1 Tax=Paracoccus tibetensis TaxID=336292 RepID=A0A1G5HBK4_9RHOB|nr:NUDIX hydrolase [Paracoccus tibetensis]SCY60358.1 hypothetical protein SAMN05660710_02057 [Paracoccus tibetensis]